MLNTTDTRNIEQAYYPGDVRLTSPPTPSLSIFVVSPKWCDMMLPRVYVLHNVGALG